MYYCAKCSEGKRGQVSLCGTARGHNGNEGLTCAQIWHFAWHNGDLAAACVTVVYESLFDQYVYAFATSQSCNVFLLQRMH